MSAQNVEQLTDLTDYLLEGLEGPDPELLRAKEDLVFYSEYLFLDEDENPIKNQDFHLELYEALQSDATYLLILLPRGFAKCLPGSTEIQLADGHLRTVQEIQTGEEVLGLNEDLQVVEDRIVAKHYSGLKKLLEVRTRTGRKISASFDHRFLSWHPGESLPKWRPLSSINQGDFLAVPRTLPVNARSRIDLTDDEISLAVAIEDNNSELVSLAQSDILWDRVEEIRVLPHKVETWDLETQKTGTFIADSVFSHNSTICSIIFPSFMLGNNPNLRFVIGSESWSQSSQFLRAIESVMKDERYQAIFGNLIPAAKTSTWNDSEKYCVRSNPFIKEPSLLALGMEGSIPSRRCDYFIGDDLISRRNSGTPEARLKVSRNFWHAFQPMARWGTRFIIAGTPYFPGDLYEELIERWGPLVDEGIAKIIRIPALKEKGKKWVSIWPARYPTEMLLRLQGFDTQAFASQYMLRPMGEGAEGIEFDPKAVKWFTKLPKEDELIDVYAFFDPGGWGKRRRTHNWSIATAFKKSGTRELNLVYSRSGKGGLKEHAKALEAMDKLWAPRRIFVESNAAQAMILEHLKEATSLPLVGYDTQTKKEERLAVFARQCADGKVKLRGKTYRGKTTAHKEIKSFWDEYTSWPSGRDDALDAAALLAERLLERGPPPALSVQESTFEAPRAHLMQRESRLFGRQRLGLFRTSRMDDEAAWYAKMQRLKERLGALKEEGVLTNEEIFDKLNKEFKFEPREANICGILLRR